MRRDDVYAHITAHRIAMDFRHGQNTLPLIEASSQMVILMEEVGEMARAILENDKQAYYREAFDVAQVIVAILEGQSNGT